MESYHRNIHITLYDISLNRLKLRKDFVLWGEVYTNRKLRNIEVIKEVSSTLSTKFMEESS